MRSQDQFPLLELLLLENYERLKVVVGSFPFVALLVAWVLADSVSHRDLALWFLAVVAVTLATLWSSVAFSRHRERLSLRSWQRLRVLSSVLNALVWGGASATVLYPADFAQQVFLLLLVGGTTGIAVSSSASYLPALLSFQFLNLPPLAARLVSEGDHLHLSMAGLVLSHLAIVVVMGVRVHKTVVRGFELERVNAELVGRLQQANQTLNSKVAERTVELERALSDRLASESRLARIQVLVELTGMGILVVEAETQQVVDSNQAAWSLLETEAVSSLAELELAGELDGWDGQTDTRLFRHLELTLTRQTLDEGDFLLILLRDVGERLRWERQMRQAQKMQALGRLAGEMAHDFNNLLMAITGFASFLAESDDSQTSHDASQILMACERGKALTSQLLVFSSDAFTAPRVIDLNLHVRQLDQMLRRLLGEQVELVTLLSETPCPVELDPGQFDQVLLNLAVNAREAMKSRGVLTIRVFDEQDTIVVEVQDDGPGVPEDDREQIFDPFFTTRPGGAGLGLASSFGIVRGAGGQLTLVDHQGAGAIFRISLPRASGQPEAAPVAPVTATKGPGQARILVVEDQEAVLAVVRRGLESQGYEVVAVHSAEEALALIKDLSSFDMLLSDVILPKMSGIELYKQLRQNSCAIPTLLMSGYVDANLVDIPNAPRLLRKPFQLVELLAAVAETLEQAPRS